MALHHGKLTIVAKTKVTEAMHELLIERARIAKCPPSDLLRDALYVVLTGISYSDHVANDRRSAMQMQGASGDSKGSTE